MQKSTTPLTAGLVAGVLATIAQALFHVTPPPAYGLCLACHARDLVNWITNVLFNTNLGLAPVSRQVPVLTVLGILGGALLSAIQRKEFKIRTTINLVYAFVLGILIMISTLTLGACLMRTVLRVAYGDLTALIGFVSIGMGVVGGTLYMKRRVGV